MKRFAMVLAILTMMCVSRAAAAQNPPCNGYNCGLWGVGSDQNSQYMQCSCYLASSNSQSCTAEYYGQCYDPSAQGCVPMTHKQVCTQVAQHNTDDFCGPHSDGCGNYVYCGDGMTCPQTAGPSGTASVKAPAMPRSMLPLFGLGLAVAGIWLVRRPRV